MSIMIFRIDGESCQADIGEKILSRAAFLSGFCVQSFSMPGAGIVKADKTPILSRQVEASDFNLVLNPSNLSEAIKNCKDFSVIIINSQKKIKTATMKKRGIKSYHLDAGSIALNHYKKELSIIPMLGALVKVYSKISMKNMKAALETEFEKDSTALEEGHKSVRLG